MKQIILCAIFILLLGAHCKKNSEEETVTINGLTFGCRVDGKVFNADYWDYGNNIPPISISFSRITYGGATLIVRAKRQNEYIEIFLNKPLIQGRHELKFNTQPWPIHDPPKDNGIYVIKNPLQEFITNETIGGYVDLLDIDTITLKVNARFEFTGTDKLTNKQVKVSNGIFKNF